ncbi:uncharacterized protein LOC120272178 [Dioscorea cayenensis subsp. rotundata]|uniref:Uncharacterized protein LOC120272178 n=1 Tax=Dioscorea cayennensis subsp. rotundata TaxID=55577 RepID=A0AB40C6V1_DIOCR|nr:uncharacterized protein LOC120272178 [Dioscorea cayenensis subsp. rotundata]
MQFLMGLNESYTNVRGNMLIMKPLPTVRQAYSLLIQEEKQREIRSRSHFTLDGVSFNAGNTYNRNVTQIANRGKSEFRKLFCEYCKKAGHRKEKCFKLHGFPNNYKGKRDKKFVASVQGNNSAQTSNYEVSSSLQVIGVSGKGQFPELTPLQCKQLMEFLSSSIQNSDSEKLLAMQIWLPLWQGPSQKRPLVLGRSFNGLYLLHLQKGVLDSAQSSNSATCS